MVPNKTVAFYTLGCKLNFSETSSISRSLSDQGFESRSFDELADIYVINTCSVTGNADKECRYLTRRIQRQSPSSFIVIIGCYAQLKPQEISEIPGVDLVLGAAEKFNLGKHLKELIKGNSAKICSCEIDEVSQFNPSFSLLDRTRAFLKIQDGCNYNCSFCTIPAARGKSRSNTIGEILKTAKYLADNGVKEIVLTGINLGDFGNQVNSAPEANENLLGLLTELQKQTSVARFRLSSIEPNLLADDIIEFVASNHKFMPHFHIPLQSGSNRILGLMRRRYKKELYSEKIRLINKLMPYCAIGIDVIVGFPGELDADFEETLRFLHSLDFSYLHVFTYSERDNTKAIEMTPTVPCHIRNERNKILRNLSYQKNEQFTKSHEGQIRKVLFERYPRQGLMEGYTDNYIKITTPFRQEWANEIIDWKI